jgi:hypothetical protein
VECCDFIFRLSAWDRFPNAVWIGRYFSTPTCVITAVKMRAARMQSVSWIQGRTAGPDAGYTQGFLAVKMIYLTFYYIPETGDYINFQLLLGLAVIIGHIFPVFANFRGGKGVATLLGVILAIDPISTLDLHRRISFHPYINQICFTEFYDCRTSPSRTGNCSLQYHYLIAGNFLTYHFRIVAFHPSEEYRKACKE